MTNEKLVWTIEETVFPFRVCHIKEWVFLEETEKCLIVSQYGGRKRILKENSSYFFSKEDALLARQSLIEIEIYKVNIQLTKLKNELRNKNGNILVQPSEPPPIEIELKL